MKLFDLHELADSTRDDSKQDREREASVKRGEDNIHADDIEFLVEEDQMMKRKKTGVQSLDARSNTSY